MSTIHSDTTDLKYVFIDGKNSKKIKFWAAIYSEV